MNNLFAENVSAAGGTGWDLLIGYPPLAIFVCILNTDLRRPDSFS